MASVEPADFDQPVAWTAQGSTVSTPGGDASVALRLCGETAVTMRCQRCLQPMVVPLRVDTRFRFAATEEAAARLDAEIDDDVLVITRDLDLRELLEDELLLALPLVPRHDTCAKPLVAPAADDEPTAAHPFAALATLRKRTAGGG